MTLGELLIVFIIMGIIATMTMVTVKPNEKSLKHVYYRIYNSIGTAFYNSSINMSEDLRDDPNMDKSFPTKAELFCKLLLEYINTQAGTNATCSNNTVNVDNPDFSDDKVQFIASNGVKIWIGHSANKAPGEFSVYNGRDNTNTEFTLRYYWVFADLNGQMGPNSPTPRGGGMADIVPFIVTEDYEVVPMGRPEVDVRYFVARVVYSSTSGTDDSDMDTSTTMSLLAAKRHAWGEADKKFYVSSNEPMSMNFYDGENITAASPFWIDYNSSEFSSIMAQTVNEQCGKEVIETPGDGGTEGDGGEDGEDGTTEPTTPRYEVEPDACYITIQDFY